MLRLGGQQFLILFKLLSRNSFSLVLVLLFYSLTIELQRVWVRADCRLGPRFWKHVGLSRATPGRDEGQPSGVSKLWWDVYDLRYFK